MLNRTINAERRLRAEIRTGAREAVPTSTTKADIAGSRGAVHGTRARQSRDAHTNGNVAPRAESAEDRNSAEKRSGTMLQVATTELIPHTQRQLHGA